MKKLFKRYTPSQSWMREHPHLRHFGQRLHDPELWHLNRRSASGAVALGLFISFLPLPLQMLLAAAGALMLRVNLPIAMVSVWASNPVTFAPMMLLGYELGAWLLDLPFKDVHFSLDASELWHTFLRIWEPLLLGCIILGAISALIGYITVRMLWWLQLVRAIEKRRLRGCSRRDDNED